MKNCTAILYAHVSTGIKYSFEFLAYQEAVLREYCDNNSIEIIGFYSDVSTANPLQRTGFAQLLYFVEQNVGVVDIILITNYSKIISNYKEAVDVLAKMEFLSIYAEAIRK